MGARPRLREPRVRGLEARRAPGQREIVFLSRRHLVAGRLAGEHDLRLSYDPKQKAFSLDDGAKPQAFALPPGREFTVDLLAPAGPGSSVVLIGGQVVDTQTVPFVTFYADGTCSPFRVQFRAAGSAAQVVAIDPWTCARELTPPEGSP